MADSNLSILMNIKLVKLDKSQIKKKKNETNNNNTIHYVFGISFL
jgi:hypothetical protein